MHNFIFKKFRSIYFPVFLSKWIADFFLFLLCMIVYIYFEFSNIFKKSPSLLIQKEEVRAKLFNIYSPPSSKKKFVQNSADIKLSLRDKVELAIIVPFYNEAAFIEKCVSSALAQRTTFSFIVLAIDDGSTDHGAETLEEFKKFDNFFLIKQKNQGFSGARNIGIQLAKKYAKYLFFLDGDDYLFSNNSIDCLLTEALRVNADLVDGSYAEIRGYEKSYHKFNHVIKKNGISNEDIVLGYAWGRVMKVELWKDIYFPQNYWFEDTILNFFIIPKVKVYAAVDEICYAYLVNPKGITQSSKGKIKNLDTLYIVEYMLKELTARKISIDVKYSHLVLFQLSARMSRLNSLPEDIRFYAFLYASFIVKKYLHQDQIKRQDRFIFHVFTLQNFQVWNLLVKLRI
ncbi:glycosyltransferase family 2 protein [Oenococcus oeni]|uniref:Glycosyltransferase 2-like domain-containing protein n=5 Tax=Oenococcus oeni TaxID=1247 RepID=D3LB02_OENOE|nr:glycosyltransferase family 2 protein [Oenococcus oeni]EFD87957.1 hypothetical protein AWRIB429_1532 [Oenococcus oeni AWRIB429]EJN92339.1 glycosyl transferase, family 2 [Oenococcus oeni AWRIB304]EJO00806.1 glycosyl transferase, family 2 [Oenococcus oeni AWRIB318]EJO10193.1 glycosyl transferase, family 2 [Oenococcus oeni AWRIB576]EJO10775.1 glycosyl transferase, family 2 [Oenococcus oeni AWRIB568]